MRLGPKEEQPVIQFQMSEKRNARSLPGNMDTLILSHNRLSGTLCFACFPPDMAVLDVDENRLFGFVLCHNITGLPWNSLN